MGPGWLLPGPQVSAAGATDAGAGARPPGTRATGGRGVFILLDKVCVQLWHPRLVQLWHPHPPHYIVTNITAMRVDWRVDTP